MIPAAEFLKINDQWPVLDVRSPGEFAQGHIPGAISFPLFTNEERAVVGTTYKQEGKDLAFESGLRFVGPKMEQFVKEAKALAPAKKVAVHCWRGGQRSGAMAWLLRQAGFEVALLEGGYKAYRRYVLDFFERVDIRMVIIGGRTGTGKTKILRALNDLGEEIIDLEKIAHHKGSAFGFIGEEPQPTVEQFENDLVDAISRLKRHEKVWVENESRSIGRVYIPEPFWKKMKDSPLVNIEIPPSGRIENLLADYVLTDRDELAEAFLKIEKKLGGLQLKQALEHLSRNDFAPAARIALDYYDKTYQYGLDTNPSPDIRLLSFDHNDPLKIATALLELKFD